VGGGEKNISGTHSIYWCCWGGGIPFDPRMLRKEDALGGIKVMGDGTVTISQRIKEGPNAETVGLDSVSRSAQGGVGVEKKGQGTTVSPGARRSR